MPKGGGGAGVKIVAALIAGGLGYFAYKRFAKSSKGITKEEEYKHKVVDTHKSVKEKAKEMTVTVEESAKKVKQKADEITASIDAIPPPPKGSSPPPNETPPKVEKSSDKDKTEK